MGGYSYGLSMGLDEYENTVTRTVWESSDRTRLLTVTSLLKPGKYEVDKTVNEEGNIVLEFELTE